MSPQRVFITPRKPKMTINGSLISGVNQFLRLRKPRGLPRRALMENRKRIMPAVIIPPLNIRPVLLEKSKIFSRSASVVSCNRASSRWLRWGALTVISLFFFFSDIFHRDKYDWDGLKVYLP